MKPSDFDPTLDSPLETPGTIAVIGGGILGIEAALYGRYLGYQVTVFEAGEVGKSWLCRGDEPLPMLPDRSISPLAASALAAQTIERGEALPVTCAGWVNRLLRPLTETDLLIGRVHEQTEILAISHSDETIDDVDPDDEIPPDFKLESDPPIQPNTFECILVAVDNPDSIDVRIRCPAPYLFHICRGATKDAEVAFAMGLKQIVTVFANLADRVDLDLYAPRRG